MSTSSSSQEPWEIEDIFRAINGNIRRLRAVRSFKADRAILFLEAIKQTIRAFCTCNRAEDSSYYEFPE